MLLTLYCLALSILPGTTLLLGIMFPPTERWRPFSSSSSSPYGRVTNVPLLSSPLPYQSSPLKGPYQSSPLKGPYQSSPLKGPYQSSPLKGDGGQSSLLAHSIYLFAPQISQKMVEHLKVLISRAPVGPLFWGPSPSPYE